MSLFAFLRRKPEYIKTEARGEPPETVAAPAAAEPAAPEPATPEPMTPAPADPGAPAAEALAASLYQPNSLAAVLTVVRQAGFVEEAYYQAYQDLQDTFPNSYRAFLHFLAMAKTERRLFPVKLNLDGMAAIHALPSDEREIISGVLAALSNAAGSMGPIPRLDLLQSFWPTAMAARRFGAKPYLIVGDSHSVFYCRSTVRGRQFLLPLHICCKDAAAEDLSNAHSPTGYGGSLKEIFAFLQKVEEGDEIPLLIQFGQIDLEFVYPFRRVGAAKKTFDQQDFQDFIAATVRRYVAFLEDLIPPARRGRTTILGVFPPALKDEPLRHGYVGTFAEGVEGINRDVRLKAGLSELQWPNLANRTSQHSAYNEVLERAAVQAGFLFAADFNKLIGVNGVLDERFIPYNKGETHEIDLIPTEAVLSERVWSILVPSDVETKISFADMSEEPDPALLPPLDRPNIVSDNLTLNQRHWVEDGVLIKPNFFPQDLLDAYIERRASFRPGTAWNAVGWPEGNAYEAIPQLRGLALYPPLMALLQELFGEKMMLHLALTGWVSTERDWHQDDYLNASFINTWYVAVWIALDQVTPESGPFEYVPGSHRWPLLRGDKVRNFLTPEELSRKAPNTGINEWPKYAERFLSPAIEEQIRTSGLPVKSFLGAKGDVLIWHSRLMHRGSKRVEGWNVEGEKVFSKYPRKSLITHYSGTQHRPDIFERATDAHGEIYAVFDRSVTAD